MELGNELIQACELNFGLQKIEIQNRDGAMLVLGKAKGKFPRLQLIWADGGYAGKLIDWVKQFCGWMLEIVKRNDDVTGFQVLPHRWVAESLMKSV